MGGTPMLPVGALLAGVGAAIALALISGGPPAWRANGLTVVDGLAER